ncbi:endonuclease/exonuclease/phosphatase family protein [Candidatus Uabimicrobium amorphum]|uniref:LuxR family transcriptional regulator n=1 Tax=Uabimicrobium amorphum TaxID=2596890 RepID=A0A5S9ISM6_UABAM|nr:endonuclease/exonuclease/phosphatase family protein [Candidatus Uabimicrobium amorphum]BBM86400.1 LuxR family transcriptional regulator [Candidatus Uabimicrobium amorphum]
MLTRQRIAIIISMILLLTPLVFSQNQRRTYLKMASWNIRILSDASRTDSELRKISEVAREYDLLSIIELRDEKVLKRLTQIMDETSSKKYKYVMSSGVGSGTHIEYYGFIYDSSFIKVITTPKLYSGKFKFARKPATASFKAGNFDFTIITTHVIWGKSTIPRKKEVMEMSNVFRNVERRGNEKDIILMGDFNRNPGGEEWNPLIGQSSMYMAFDGFEKTMIKDTNCYDNIFFKSMYLREWTGTTRIDRFDEDHFYNNDPKAHEVASDHRPVYARFRITGADDD